MSDFAAMMKSFMPTSFGKKVNKIDTNSVQVFEATKRNDQEPIIDDFELPISHELVLSDHERIVSCISVDPAGSRIVTGGRDETMYSFLT